jgi:hypothetical protein
MYFECFQTYGLSGPGIYFRNLQKASLKFILIADEVDTIINPTIQLLPRTKVFAVIVKNSTNSTNCNHGSATLVAWGSSTTRFASYKH